MRVSRLLPLRVQAIRFSCAKRSYTEAVTNANGIWGAFIFTLLLYATIGTIAILVLRRMSRNWREGGEGTAEDEPSPYSPEEVGV